MPPSDRAAALPGGLLGPIAPVAVLRADVDPVILGLFHHQGERVGGVTFQLAAEGGHQSVVIHVAVDVALRLQILGVSGKTGRDIVGESLARRDEKHETKRQGAGGQGSETHAPQRSAEKGRCFRGSVLLDHLDRRRLRRREGLECELFVLEVEPDQHGRAGPELAQKDTL